MLSQTLTGVSALLALATVVLILVGGILYVYNNYGKWTTNQSTSVVVERWLMVVALLTAIGTVGVLGFEKYKQMKGQ